MAALARVPVAVTLLLAHIVNDEVLVIVVAEGQRQGASLAKVLVLTMTPWILITT